MAEPIDDGPREEFSGVFTDIFPAEWAADPDFCQYLTQESFRNIALWYLLIIEYTKLFIHIFTHYLLMEYESYNVTHIFTNCTWT